MSTADIQINVVFGGQYSFEKTTKRLGAGERN